MAYVIALPCIGVKDTACIAVCPVDVIHPTRGEKDFEDVEQLYIDGANCIDCGLCVEECPVSAIYHEADISSEWRSFIEKNAAYFRSKVVNAK